MPSKNMLPKGQRHRSVRAEYKAQRGVEPAQAPPVPVLDLDDEDDSAFDVASGIRTFTADAAAAGLRLDAYLAQALPDVSRARVQLLIDAGQVMVSGAVAKTKQRLIGGEAIAIEGEPRPAPLHAFAEDIPLSILFEDEYLAVIDKPAGMMVHAGAGVAGIESNSDSESPSKDRRGKGTLVNALLFHFANLSEMAGDLRPGIVHRLDKQTSGVIVVAKDDSTHRKLGEMFSARRMNKSYLALAHGEIKRELTTVSLPISRDVIRRTRMTTRRTGPDARSAVSHIRVLERLKTALGDFTLVEVKIDTGRTHQIRVHLQSMGHPVVGDSLYGAPHRIGGDAENSLALERNFLHAARLEFVHPQTNQPMAFEAPLPEELVEFLAALQASR